MATITLTRAELGKSIEALVGDRITVSLDENPTTNGSLSRFECGDTRTLRGCR